MSESKGTRTGRVAGAGRSSLRISEDKSGNTVAVRAAGEIDALTAPRLERAVLDAVRAGSGRTVVDLQDVGFMDSAGITVLVRAAKRLKSTGRDPMVVLTSAPVRHLLQLTGIDKLVDVVAGGEDRPQAEPA